jgi:putative nucleotidyltransferase with HDIG domain
VKLYLIACLRIFSLALVFIDDLTDGMVLAEDLLTPSGRFVLAAGATIKADQLKLLKSWGVVEADIEVSSLGDEFAQQQEESAEFHDQADNFLLARFVQNDLEQEPVTTLYRHVSHLWTLKLQNGRAPEIIPDTEPVSEPKKSPAPLSTAKLLNGDVELGCLPTVYNHIVDALNHPNTSSHQLGEVISKDASLTVRLLRLVNSPFYGFSGKVETVARAVSLLGLNELSTLALGISVIKKFENIPSDQLDMESFWRHSIRCGLFARTLASYLGEKDTEKYFTGGLLHDIGRLVMLDRMPQQYSFAIARARQEHLPMYRAEQDVLKTDHSILGKMLAEKWRLSPSLIRMIGCHHSPRLAHYSTEACLIHIADIFAHACSDEVLLVNEIPELQIQAWNEIGLATDYISAAIKQVDNDFKEIIKVFFEN